MRNLKFIEVYYLFMDGSDSYCNLKMVQNSHKESGNSFEKDPGLNIKEKIFKNSQKIYENIHLPDTQILIRNDNRHKAGIYIIYNLINNKFYVGSAITNRINVRFRNHCFNCGGSKVVKKAIHKYGLENFLFIIYEYFPGIILKDNLKSENLKLLARESSIIKELNPDYNILRMADNYTGYKHTEETKPEVLKRLSALASKPVALYDIYSGQLLMSFPGIRALAKYLGCCNKTINKALKNNTSIKNKYIVKYIDI